MTTSEEPTATNSEEQLPNDEQEWTLIPSEENTNTTTTTNTRFKRSVKRIIKLLQWRKLFARSGMYLQTSRSRRTENARIRRVMTEIFTTWPRTILKKTKVIFEHLKRERGVLIYR
jgi:hypothetical protein